MQFSLFAPWRGLRGSGEGQVDTPAVIIPLLFPILDPILFDIMATWFDTIGKSFADVPVDAANGNAISTAEFLEAAEALTTLFGRLLCHCMRTSALMQEQL